MANNTDRLYCCMLRDGDRVKYKNLNFSAFYHNDTLRPQSFDRCHGSRNFCLLETTLVFALQKLRFGEPVVLCTTGSIITIQTKQIPRTRCVQV